MSKIVPCPFCGSSDVDFREMTHWTGQCSVVFCVDLNHICKRKEQDSRPPYIKVTAKTKEEAIEKWNNRN